MSAVNIARARNKARALPFIVAAMSCCEASRAESRRLVALWWLDMAAVNRRHAVRAFRGEAV